MSPPVDDPNAKRRGSEAEKAADPAAAVEGDILEKVFSRLAGRSQGFGRYRLQGEVARGGMGVILNVWDEDLRRNLAMKVVLARGESDSVHSVGSEGRRALGRFLEEAQVTGQLDHPGIVPVHELGLDDQGRVYFTMRLVTGRDLEKIFALVRDEQEGWSQTRAVGVLLKVCEAMAYAHSKNVVHRDLKPANIMVGRFGEVYVMDWGLARVIAPDEFVDARDWSKSGKPKSGVHTDRNEAWATTTGSGMLTMDGEVLGTPAYMSPEQARGELAQVGPTSDVYSVGSILYHLLAGHRPYAVPGVKLDGYATWKRVQAGSPDPIDERAPKAPAELIAICQKAMAPDSLHRYRSMQDLADDLRAYLEDRVVRAYESGALAEFKKWVKRNRTTALTALFAVCFVVGGSISVALVLAKKNEALARATAESRASEKRAHASEEVARDQAALAEDRAAKLLRLSDLERLDELARRSEELWPAYPHNLPEYEQWLADGRAVAQRLEGHRATLAEIRDRALAAVEAKGSDSAPARAWRFASTEDQWQHDTQQKLVDTLASFTDPARGAIADIEKRLAFALGVAEATVDGADARAAWERANAAIADPNGVYAGLALSPQMGLVPLGADRRSRLWEFALAQTGSIPERDPASGELVIVEDSALVFVLIPGGSFEMGAQSDDPGSPNYDPRAEPKEGLVHHVVLAPFFLSKYEMTQGQWLRFTGENPSIYRPGREYEGKLTSLLNPVEQVSWEDCDRVLRRLGLVIPTEAQWEYAARAGTSTPWWTGAEKESLDGAINIADDTAARFGANWPGIQDWPEFDDGYAVSAPVNEFTPNPFGLHSVLGNIWEWCREGYAQYGGEVREGDGERTAPDHTFRMNRGGGFYQSVYYARVSFRNNSGPDMRINHLGVRPARAIDR